MNLFQSLKTRLDIEFLFRIEIHLFLSVSILVIGFYLEFLFRIEMNLFQLLSIF